MINAHEGGHGEEGGGRVIGGKREEEEMKEEEGKEEEEEKRKKSQNLHNGLKVPKSSVKPPQPQRQYPTTYLPLLPLLSLFQPHLSSCCYLSVLDMT